MNIIDAIKNLIEHPVVDVISHYTARNRANGMGDALEEYIKDLFADTFGLTERKRMTRQSEVFSYLGNNNNPPDAMLRGGDAIEVKKIESNSSALALNSSYPKQKLCRDNPMISNKCRTAENWVDKDMIYTVGYVDNKNKLRQLAMVYGRNYCASDECYSRIKTTIKEGVQSIPGIGFSDTKELGHVNRVDPLVITYLRVRGMWGIENPWKVYSYVYHPNNAAAFNFMCIIDNAKWSTFNNTELITSAKVEGFSICDIKIKNPDNPAELDDAKLITFEK